MFDAIKEIQNDGILTAYWLRQAAQNNVIYSDKYRIPEENFQPASLDLSLGETAYSL